MANLTNFTVWFQVPLGLRRCVWTYLLNGYTSQNCVLSPLFPSLCTHSPWAVSFTHTLYVVSSGTPSLYHTAQQTHNKPVFGNSTWMTRDSQSQQSRLSWLTSLSIYASAPPPIVIISSPVHDIDQIKTKVTAWHLSPSPLTTH